MLVDLIPTVMMTKMRLTTVKCLGKGAILKQLLDTPTVQGGSEVIPLLLQFKGKQTNT